MVTGQGEPLKAPTKRLHGKLGLKLRRNQSKPVKPGGKPKESLFSHQKTTYSWWLSQPIWELLYSQIGSCNPKKSMWKLKKNTHPSTTNYRLNPNMSFFRTKPRQVTHTINRARSSEKMNCLIGVASYPKGSCHDLFASPYNTSVDVPSDHRWCPK